MSPRERSGIYEGSGRCEGCAQRFAGCAELARLRAQHSFEELNATFDRVDHEFDEPSTSAEVVEIGINVRKNIVQVSLAEYDPRAARKLRSRYGVRACFGGPPKR